MKHKELCGGEIASYATETWSRRMAQSPSKDNKYWISVRTLELVAKLSDDGRWDPPPLGGLKDRNSSSKYEFDDYSDCSHRFFLLVFKDDHRTRMVASTSPHDQLSHPAPRPRAETSSLLQNILSENATTLSLLCARQAMPRLIRRIGDQTLENP